MAYERLLDKSRQPSDGEMAESTGGLSDAWKSLRAFIEANYGIEPVVKFGGKKYGWLVNYRKGGRPLCDLYPEQGFHCTGGLGKKRSRAGGSQSGGIFTCYWRIVSEHPPIP